MAFDWVVCYIAVFSVVTQRSSPQKRCVTTLKTAVQQTTDWAKWSNYVHSHISGTQCVNTTPFCASTQALVPEHQMWKAP